ncbi:MAG: hypothetical protein JSU57_00925, partial [Candidatus Heimdallarchaeota archaeon]
MSFAIYMIRNGLFGQDYEMKLILALIGLSVCVLFILFSKKNDYFYVFATGLIIWSIFELMITVLGIRSSIDASIFGIDLHWILAGVIRGSSEGSVVAIVGIIFGDYIPSRKHRKIAFPAAILLLTYFVSRTLINALPRKNIGGDVLSRRDVFALPSVLFFLFFSLFIIIWFLSQKELHIKKRVRNMFITTCIFSLIWSIAQYIANTRWIEIQTNNTYVQAPPIVEFLVFTWDILFEISMCYVAFLVVPYILNLIKTPQETEIV